MHVCYFGELIFHFEGYVNFFQHWTPLHLSMADVNCERPLSACAYIRMASCGEICCFITSE